MAGRRLHRRQPALHRRRRDCATPSATAMSKRCASPGPEVPESADFVMYWWHHAAALVSAGQAAALRLHHHQQPEADLQPPRRPAAPRRSGLPPRLRHPRPPVGRQRRRRGRAHRDDRRPRREHGDGRLLHRDRRARSRRRRAGGDARTAAAASIHADLRIGADVAGRKRLRANGGISSPRFQTAWCRFHRHARRSRSASKPTRRSSHYRNGRDLTDRPRGVKIIDLFGLTAARRAQPLSGDLPVGARTGEAGARPESRVHATATTGGCIAEPREDSARSARRPARATSPPSKPPSTASSSSSTPASRRTTCWSASRSTTPIPSACCPAPCMSSGRWRRAARSARQRSGLRQNPLLRNLPLPRRHARTASPHRAPSPNNSTPTASASRRAHPDLTLTGIYNVLAKICAAARR